MARIQNISQEDREVPWLNGRHVLAEQIIEVPDEDVYAFTCQTEVWSPADEATQALHDEAAAAVAEEVAAVEEAVDQRTAFAGERPKGDAGRREWVEWVVASGLATVDELEDLGRNQIRDLYGKSIDDPTGDDDVTDESDPTGDDDVEPDPNTSNDDEGADDGAQEG